VTGGQLWINRLKIASYKRQKRKRKKKKQKKTKKDMMQKEVS